MLITSTKSLKNKFIKAIVYGPSGNGKTTLAKTLSEKYKPIILSLEGGLLSLSGSDVDSIDLTIDNNGKLLPVAERPNRIRDAYKFLQTEEAKSKYKTVFIDSLTEIAQAVHAMVSKEFPDRKDALPMWGQYNTVMRDTVKAFRDLPGYHVVFTCLSKVDKDDSGKRFAAFDCQGGIADKLPGFMDLVLYIRLTETGDRELLCQPTDSIPAKDRSGKLNKTEAADLDLLFNKIIGENNV
jgi:phage nucleotide-binding protein